VLRLLLTVFLLAAVLGAPAAADMDEALDLLDEGDAAFKGGNYAGAAKLYREALEAAETCLPARFGLGEALLAMGDAQGAVVAFRQVIRQVRSEAGIPAAWQELARKAQARLTKHDANGRKLEALIDAHVAKVMKVALKYRRKDPDLSDRALDVVLSLRPDHKRASEVRAAMSSKGARKEAIFDGKQIADWDGGRSSDWSVEDGVIVSESKGIATFIRNQEEIKGNFDVIMEARIAKVHDRTPFLALMAGWTAEYDHTRLGTLSGALTWFEHRGEDDKEQVFRKEAKRLRRPYDPSKWNVYELRYREGWIHALVNGREVHKLKRPEARAGGYVGILSQGCRGEVKRLEVLHR